MKAMGKQRVCRDSQPFRYALNNYRAAMQRSSTRPDGMTYVIESGQHWKIGFCRSDIKGRMQKLQTASPYELRLVRLVPLNVELEARLVFYRNRVRGEWFNPCDGILDWIDRVAAGVEFDMEAWIANELRATRAVETRRFKTPNIY